MTDLHLFPSLNRHDRRGPRTLRGVRGQHRRPARRVAEPEAGDRGAPHPPGRLAARAAVPVRLWRGGGVDGRAGAVHDVGRGRQQRRASLARGRAGAAAAATAAAAAAKRGLGSQQVVC